MRRVETLATIFFAALITACFAAMFSSCRSCALDLDGDVVVFGTAFDEVAGTTLICWPADEAGATFRYLVSDDARNMHDSAPGGTTRESGWSVDVKSAHRILVVLPPDSSGELRARAAELLAALERRFPGAGMHRVFSDEDWLAARSGRDVSIRLRRLAERSREVQQKHRGLGGALEGIFDGAFAALMMPGMTVIMGEEEERPFRLASESALLGGAPDQRPRDEMERLDAENLEARVRTALAAQKRAGREEGYPGGLQVVVVLASDLSDPALARASAMLERIAEYDRLTASLHRSEQTLAELLAFRSK